jgi:hypothetical protein
MHGLQELWVADINLEPSPWVISNGHYQKWIQFVFIISYNMSLSIEQVCENISKVVAQHEQDLADICKKVVLSRYLPKYV